MAQFQIILTSWQVLILINLVEKELEHTRDREFEKREALKSLQNNLQAQSFGPKPFDIQTKI